MECWGHGLLLLGWGSVQLYSRVEGQRCDYTEVKSGHVPCGWTAGLSIGWGVGQKRAFSLRGQHDVCFLSPSAISSLLAAVTLDLSQYALDIGKGLAGECPDASPAPRMTPWVFGCTCPNCRRRGTRQLHLEINYSCWEFLS